MHKYIFLVSVFVFCISGEDIKQSCIDCMEFTQCKNALDLALHKRDEETKRLFKEAVCEMDMSDSPVAKVCCSNFIVETDEDIRVKNHPNQKLLPEDCGTIKGDRIVGGKKANIYEFPWMALISHNTRNGLAFKCGGSVINSRYVLTAAHCVQDKMIAGVRIGEYDVRYDIDCQGTVCEDFLQDMRVEKAIVHKGYRGLPRVINDIALLRLEKDIDFSHKNAYSICLPKTTPLRHRSVTNVNATVAGWGLTEDGRESSILLKVTIPIHTAEQCSSLYNRFSKPGQPDATENQLCAGTLNMDSCNGDSGGPLMIEEKYNNVYKYIQYGVVSHGPQKCGSDYPGVYTDVRQFMGWILDNIAP